MGTITFTVQTATPQQTLTKTYTDTDANIVLAVQAMQWQFSQATVAQGALAWTKSVIQNIINVTNNYQQQTAPVTPINPT